MLGYYVAIGGYKSSIFLKRTEKNLERVFWGKSGVLLSVFLCVLISKSLLECMIQSEIISLQMLGFVWCGSSADEPERDLREEDRSVFWRESNINWSTEVKGSSLKSEVIGYKDL